MIEYRFPEEKALLLHYAKALAHKSIEKIVTQGQIESAEEAKELARFFWFMVDQIVADEEKEISVLGNIDLQSLCQSIMQTLRSHFIATGYMQIWENESDNA